MTCEVRTASDTDDSLMRQIQRAAYPDYVQEPASLLWFPAGQLDAPANCPHKLVACQSGVPAGYAAVWRVKEEKYRFDLLVHPEYRGSGIGSALFEVVLRIAMDSGARTLQGRARADDERASIFLHRRGFVETQRMTGFERELADLDSISIPSVSKFSVVTLSEAQTRNPSWRSDLLALLAAAQDGWPDPDPDPSGLSQIGMRVFERLLSNVEEPDAFFVGADQGTYIGVSSLHTLGTAVHPAYRGRGIATLLHYHALRKARLDGLVRIVRPTANRAMRAVFLKLGYRQSLTEVRMILRSDRASL